MVVLCKQSNQVIFVNTCKTSWTTIAIKKIIDKYKENIITIRESDKEIILIFYSNNHQYYQVKSSKIPPLGLIGFQSQVSSNIWLIYLSISGQSSS